MPTGFLNADVSFPQFRKEQSADEKIDSVASYLFMLLEQLRYSLQNLGQENFNENSLQDIANIITEPVYIQLSDVDGRTNSVIADVTNLTSRLYDPTTGSISVLQQTATGLTSRLDSFGVTDFSTSSTYNIGDYVTYGGYTYRCTEKITTPGAWDSDKWVLDSNTSAEARHSLLNQTVYGLTIDVTTENDVSYIQILSNGVDIGSSGQINLSGLVTFESLRIPAWSAYVIYRAGSQVTYDGKIYTCKYNSTVGDDKSPAYPAYWTDTGKNQTIVNGGNITTGAISSIAINSCIMEANEIVGGTITGSLFRCVLGLGSGGEYGTVSGAAQFFYMNTNDENLAGMIRLDDQGTGSATDAQFRMFIQTKSVDGTPFNMKLDSAGGISLTAADLIYIQAGDYITIRSDDNINLRPGTNKNVMIYDGNTGVTLAQYIQNVVHAMGLGS